jgi:hypothetical protein
MQPRPLPDLKFFAERLRFDHEAGRFFCITSGAPRCHVRADGYRRINVRDFDYPAHRVGWLMFYGVEPSGLIDHIDGDRANNQICNLRIATQAENCRNSARKARSLPRGVKCSTSGRKFYAQIRDGSKQIHLGTFTSVDDAYAAYCAEAVRLHGNFARFD